MLLGRRGTAVAGGEKCRDLPPRPQSRGVHQPDMAFLRLNKHTELPGVTTENCAAALPLS
jgi:hypothetical protein